MNKKSFAGHLLGLWAVLTLMTVPAPAQSLARSTEGLLLGAVRWDNWTPDSPHSKTVLNDDHPERTPFFAVGQGDGSKLLGGIPEVVHAENAYARSAGLDYWLFGYFGETGAFGRPVSSSKRLNRSLETFRGLHDRSGMRFALMLHQTYPYSDVGKLAQELAPSFKDRDYLEVEGELPLFAGGFRGWEETLGDGEKVRRFFVELRDTLSKLSGRQVRLTAVGSDLERLPNYVGEGKPFTGFTSYVDAPPNDGVRRSASQCRQIERAFWKRAVSLKLPFTPNVTLGWDMSPVLDHPDQLYNRSDKPSICAFLNEQDWQDHIGEALALTQSLPSDGLRGLLFYAWNEMSEGGWLVPTRGEETKRLLWFAQAVGRRPALSKVELVFPDDGDPHTTYDIWPCPLGMEVASEEAVVPDKRMNGYHDGRWIKRVCNSRS